VVNDPKRRANPVEVSMKITTKFADTMHNDCTVELTTAGVLGEVFVDLDCRHAKGGPLENGAELATRDVPQLQDVVRASQGTLENLDVLIKKLNDIVAFIQSGQGSIGKIIYDPSLFDRANAVVGQLQQIATQINSPKGTIGKLLNSEELYDKINGTVDNANKIIVEVNNGNGTVGKLLKDPSLYDNANKLVANGNQLVADVNAGKGTLGKLAKDEDMARRINDTITRLNNITAQLDKGEGTAGKFLKDPSLYNNADSLLVETQSLIKAVRQDPKKYLTIHLKIF